MIFLQKNIKTFLKTLVICTICCAVFIGTGYLYLEGSTSKTDNGAEQVPYYSVPQNCGVVIEVGGDLTFLYLAFEDGRIIVVPKGEEADFLRYGYTVDYLLSTNFKMVAGLVDRLGGIDIAKDTEVYSYTGTQVENLLSFSSEIYNDKIIVLQGLLQKIAEVGLTADDLLYIISQSETKLTLPDCYFWAEHLKNICKNAVFID